MLYDVSVAQWIARRTSNPKVAGSNPAGGGFLKSAWYTLLILKVELM